MTTLQYTWKKEVLTRWLRPDQALLPMFTPLEAGEWGLRWGQTHQQRRFRQGLLGHARGFGFHPKSIGKPLTFSQQVNNICFVFSKAHSGYSWKGTQGQDWNEVDQLSQWEMMGVLQGKRGGWSRFCFEGWTRRACWWIASGRGGKENQGWLWGFGRALGQMGVPFTEMGDWGRRDSWGGGWGWAVSGFVAMVH